MNLKAQANMLQVNYVEGNLINYYFFSDSKEAFYFNHSITNDCTVLYCS